jgi:hypothetical protein
LISKFVHGFIESRVMKPRVLIIGATGFFGRLLVDDLMSSVDCELLLASRRPLQSTRFETVATDLGDTHSLERALNRIDIAICAAGPYQGMPTSLVEVCLRRGIHYVDMADDRAFVRKVRSIADASEKTTAAVCTGWSTVPALSGLLTTIAIRGMTTVDSIHIHMAPGNRAARQVATIASLMHSVGQPFTLFRNGAWHWVRGWSEPRDFIFPSPVGKRCGYLVDVPDHEIFPQLFGARTVAFRAGSELHLINSCLSLLSWSGQRWVQWSRSFQRVAALSSWIGHDWGAIGVEVTGTFKRAVCIVAESHAERIAVMPASVMTRMLLSRSGKSGVISYTNWLSEEQLQLECDKRGFRLVVEDR